MDQRGQAPHQNEFLLFSNKKNECYEQTAEKVNEKMRHLSSFDVSYLSYGL